MPDPIINLITAPDKLLNNNASVLLVNPSDAVKEQFNHHAKQFKAPINLYLYENIEEQLGWLFDIIPAIPHILQENLLFSLLHQQIFDPGTQVNLYI